jgi:hypothetical protein
MKRIVFAAAGSILLLLALLYCGDFLMVRFRIPRSREPFGTVTVTPVYIIHEKNGKTEYDFKDPENDPCVRSLFPHFGYPPCWYLRRHPERQIEI